MPILVQEYRTPFDAARGYSRISFFMIMRSLPRVFAAMARALLFELRSGVSGSPRQCVCRSREVLRFLPRIKPHVCGRFLCNNAGYCNLLVVLVRVSCAASVAHIIAAYINSNPSPGFRASVRASCKSRVVDAARGPPISPMRTGMTEAANAV
ncbi:hypothetical protein EVG20_g11702 [Dentipellis fragilis]|uniref:Uncharacterized protein n=1 Tax=Dentipellis fragilis TaxID=205917 RepID=A0A4Y9XJC6_9AGAM|nr:hypothetical protein EVG20_g11702 [Dentipellis fragilis]